MLHEEHLFSIPQLMFSTDNETQIPFLFLLEECAIDIPFSES